MKSKIIALVLVLSMLSIAGCASDSFLCRNKDSILNGLQQVINISNSIISVIEASYPGVIPAAAAAVIAAAQIAKNAATLAASNACPTVEQLVDAESKLADAQMQLAIAVKYQGLKLGR